MGWQQLDAYLRSRGIRIGAPTTGQTTGGRHAPGSYHFKGLARDYGTANSDCVAVYQALEPFARNGTLVELFWQDRAWKTGRRISAVSGHWNHVHAALAPGRSLPTEEDDLPYSRDDIKQMIREVLNEDQVRDDAHGDGRMNRILKELEAIKAKLG